MGRGTTCTMFLLTIAASNPMAALALLLNLTTLCWCIRLYRLQYSKINGELLAFVGMVAMNEALRILQSAGVWAPPTRTLSGLVDAAVAALYLLGLVILKHSSADHLATLLRLRVSEANEARTGALHSNLLRERSALAVVGIDHSGAVDLWHNSAEEFFGWTREEVLGKRLPFTQAISPDETASGAPQILPMTTKRGEHLDALIWMMPVPGEAKSLLLVLDYRKAEASSKAPAVLLSRPLPLHDRA